MNRRRLLILLATVIAAPLLQSCGDKNKDSFAIPSWNSSGFSPVDKSQYELEKVRYNDSAYLPYESEFKNLRAGMDMDLYGIAYSDSALGQKYAAEWQDVRLKNENAVLSVMQYFGLYDFKLPNALIYENNALEPNDYYLNFYSQEELDRMYQISEITVSDLYDASEDYVSALSASFASLDYRAITPLTSDDLMQKFLDSLDSILSGTENKPDILKENVSFKLEPAQIALCWGKVINDDPYYLVFIFSEESLEVSFYPSHPYDWAKIKQDYEESGLNEQVTVSFEDSDGRIIKTETVKKYGSVDAPEAPKVEGKDFLYWDKLTSVVTKNIVVKPVYKDSLVSKDIIYVDENGQTIKQVTIVDENDSKAPTPPAKANHTFIGWLNSGSSGDATVVKPLYSNDSNPYTFGSVAYYYWELENQMNTLSTYQEKVDFLMSVSDEIANASALRDYPMNIVNEGRALCLLLPCAHVYNNYGTILVHSGFRKNAIPYLENAVRLEPTNPVYLTNLAEFIFQDEKAKGDKSFTLTKYYCNEALKNVSDYGYALQLLETVCLEQERPDEALDYLVKSSYTLWNDVTIAHWQSVYFDLEKSFSDAFDDGCEACADQEVLEIDFKSPIGNYLDDLKAIANIQTKQGHTSNQTFKCPLSMDGHSYGSDYLFLEDLSNDLRKEINSAKMQCKMQKIDKYMFFKGINSDYFQPSLFIDSRAFTMGIMIDQYYSQLLKVALENVRRNGNDYINDLDDEIANSLNEAIQNVEDIYQEIVDEIGEQAFHAMSQIIDGINYLDTGSFKAGYAEAEMFAASDPQGQLKEATINYFDGLANVEKNSIEKYYRYFGAILSKTKEGFDTYYKDIMGQYYSDLSYICSTLTDADLCAYFDYRIICNLYDSYITCYNRAFKGSEAVFWAEYGYRVTLILKEVCTGIIDEAEIESCTPSKDEWDNPNKNKPGNLGISNAAIGFNVGAFGFSASATLEANGSISFGVDSPFAQQGVNYSFLENKITTTTIVYSTFTYGENLLGGGLGDVASVDVFNAIKIKDGSGYQKTFTMFGATEIKEVEYHSVDINLGTISGSASSTYVRDSASSAFTLDNYTLTANYKALTVSTSFSPKQ